MNEDELNERNLYRIRGNSKIDESFHEMNTFNFTFPTMITLKISYENFGPDKLPMISGDENIPELEHSNLYSK